MSTISSELHKLTEAMTEQEALQEKTVATVTWFDLYSSKKS